MGVHCVWMSENPRIDEVDRQIVALLRENARRSFQDIGGRVSLSAPAVKRRVDRLEEAGVIRGYGAVVDPGRFGWTTQAFVELHTDGRFSGEDVKVAVANHPEVVAAYTVAGDASAILLVRAESTEHLEGLLERLRENPAIRRSRTAVVLSTLIERPFRP